MEIKNWMKDVDKITVLTGYLCQRKRGRSQRVFLQFLCAAHGHRFLCFLLFGGKLLICHLSFKGAVVSLMDGNVLAQGFDWWLGIEFGEAAVYRVMVQVSDG